jgi:outer membrane lipoprotein carrier protein
MLLFSVFATASSATPSEQLDSLLSSFKAVTASFRQTSVVKNNISKTSSGTMALQRPGKFRWETTSPSHQLIVADGKYLWIFDADLEQATKQSLAKDSHSPAMLLSGSTQALEQRFEIINAKAQDDKMLFDLKPKNKQDLVRQIELQFVNRKLNRMSVIDNLGQKTIFYFSNVAVNPNLSNKLFQFHPPKGTDVIKNL